MPTEISREQLQTASLLAGAILAAEIANELHAKDFYVHWKALQTPRNRALVDFFETECKKIRCGMADEMADALKEEKHGPSS
jgi:hypothetical protein